MNKIKIQSLGIPLLSKLDLPDEVKRLINTLAKLQNQVYLVGGFVRDLILGKKSKDLDFILVDIDTENLSKDLCKEFNATYIVLDKDTGTTRFILKDESCIGYSFDFTSIKKENLLNDFRRRDFTINALAINLKDENFIIDNFSGLKDLREKNINAIDLKNLSDDPLRFLRAFRFGSELNGNISKEILEYIKNNLTLFNNAISVERISTELWKILDSNSSYSFFKLLSEIGLLEKIFPEISNMRNVPPNDHHHLNLHDHSLELLKTYEENSRKIPSWAKNEIEKSLTTAESPKVSSVIKLGCLFHDIGKPNTWEIKNVNGHEKHTFIGHDKVGTEIVKKISERLKFSNAISDLLCVLVRYHLRPFQLSNNDAPITNRALFRFFRDLNFDTPRLLMLCLADMHATLGPKVTKDDIEKNEKLILFLFDEYKKYIEKENEIATRPKLLDGNEVMKITGLKPSKQLGNLLSELDEAIGIGEIKTKDEAISWVKSRF